MKRVRRQSGDTIHLEALVKIYRSIGAIGVILVSTLSPTACDVPQSVSPGNSTFGRKELSATDALHLAALASADSTQLLDAQLEYLSRRSIQDVARLSRSGNMQIVGFSHVFRYKSQVQIGVFDLPEALTADVALAEYKQSTGEFLREAIRSTTMALAEETDPENRQSYRELLQAFRLRLDAFEHDNSGIYSLRVRARAGFLAGLLATDKTVGKISLAEGPLKRFRAPSLPADIDAVMSMTQTICPLSVGGGKLASMGSGVSVSSLPLPDPCQPPPDDGQVAPPPSYQGPPTYDTGTPQHLATYVSVPLADPYNDDTYYDDNSVDNTLWAPTEGKSYVDRDRYSKYTIQHWLWKFPHLTLYTAVCSVCTKLSFEGEVHQDGRNGQQVYANGFFSSPDYRDRGEVWESNFPSAYRDTQFLDRADVPNHTIGTTAPERLQYNTFYYTWIRFSQYTAGASSGKIQIAVQLGDRDGYCLTPNGWCSLTSLETVRVLPWICGYRAPNSVTMGGLWKRWYHDGYGYKNEQCRSTP